MLKSFTAFGLTACLLLSMSACSSAPATSPAASSQQDVSVSTVNPTPPPSTYDPDPDGVSVTMKIDEALSQAIVTVTNGGQMALSANLHVRFYDANHTTVGSDTIFVEALPAGNFSYARIKLDSVSTITMEHKFSHVELVEGSTSEGGALDEAASAGLTEDFSLSFGGAGNPEWATSWYKYAEKIEVYAAGNEKYALVTVKADSPKDGIDRIGNTIFGNYRDDYGLTSVRLVTPDGETVFTRSAS